MQIVIDIDEDLYEGIERRDGAFETEYVCNELMKAIDNGTPQQKTGHWIDCEILNEVKCSSCRMCFGQESNYCPNCGAKMESEGKE